MTAQANEMSAGVTQHILTDWHDGLAKASALWLGVVKGDGREKIGGGTLIQFAIKLKKNQAQAFIAGSGSSVGLTTSVQNQYGVLNWKYAYWATNFTLADMTIANGEEDKIKILKKKTIGSLNDATRLFASATYLGTFNSAGGTQASNPLYFDGLEDVVVASGTSYAGLTDTDYTDDTSAYLPYISTNTTPNYDTVADMINTVRARIQVSEYNPERIFGLMSPAVFTKFQSEVKQSVFLLDTKNMYAIGMQGFRVNGVEFYLDAYVPGTGTSGSADNYIYIIPQDVFKFHYKFGFDNPSPFDVNDLRVPDQPVLSTQNFVVGNWVCTDRRLIAVAKTITL